MRQKRVLPNIEEKYIAFLSMLKEKQFDGESLTYLVQINKINKSIINALKKLEFIEFRNDNHWRWITDDNFKSNAHEVLNYLLELNKKQIVTPIIGLDSETKGYIKAIHDQLISNSQNKSDASQGLKHGNLVMPLNKSEVESRNHLFSKIESDENKKFELLKAVAGGWFAQSDFITPYQQVNDTIILATEDLFNKFFKK